MQKNYNAGIYCQLSREDERSGKLVSVENQKIMLERYVHTGVDPLARDRELDMLFERLYEDNVSGKIDDARFVKMSKRYEQKQGENAGRIKALRDRIAPAAARLTDKLKFRIRNRHGKANDAQ